ncbi:hypothetical protein [Amycolatopsis sp. NPDC051903]|uniref:hypothetical protein n=1 Tax=Amycolatopsis sp. NPDC051903 TaxID=3363936 RepID=UPI00379DE47C
MPEQGPRFSVDPLVDRGRRALLAKLAANTAKPGMAELARELLAGNISPREAVNSNVYSAVLNDTTSGFTRWYGALSETEKDASAESGREALLRLADEDQQAPPKRASALAQDEDDDFSERDWLDG